MRQPTEVFRQDGRKLQWSVGTRGRHAKGRQILHLYLSRAYWRMCADHPVELPANDGCMEARPGSCHRKYGRTEMRARNPIQRARAGEAMTRSGIPCRCGGRKAVGWVNGVRVLVEFGG